MALYEIGQHLYLNTTITSHAGTHREYDNGHRGDYVEVEVYVPGAEYPYGVRHLNKQDSCTFYVSALELMSQRPFDLVLKHQTKDVVAIDRRKP